MWAEQFPDEAGRTDTRRAFPPSPLVLAPVTVLSPAGAPTARTFRGPAMTFAERQPEKHGDGRHSVTAPPTDSNSGVRVDSHRDR